MSGPAELAQKAGLTRANVQKYWEGKVAQPRGDALRRLARAIGRTEEWLRTGEPPIRKDELEVHDSATKAATVSEVDVRASAGGGAVVDREGEVFRWQFPAPWVRGQLNARPSDLKIITIEGDSMVSEPPSARDIQPGDKAVVNIADRVPTPPGIFVIHDGLGLVAKRVEHIPDSDPPSITIRSNNPHYSTYTRSLDEVHIMGRVIGRFQRL